LWQWAGRSFTSAEKALLIQARELFTDTKPEIIAGLIEEDEISATIARIDRALIEESFPVPSPDWPAVPWPPF
jgi:hypothetical protein